jgi:hypothetical protein
VRSNAYFLTRFFVYFFINGKSMSQAALAPQHKITNQKTTTKKQQLKNKP